MMTTTIDRDKYKYEYDYDGLPVYSTVELSESVLERCVISQLKRTAEHPNCVLVDVDDNKFLIGQPYFDNPPDIERIRRITGYLTGTLESWNDGKQAEEQDRVKHSTTTT